MPHLNSTSRGVRSAPYQTVGPSTGCPFRARGAWSSVRVRLMPGRTSDSCDGDQPRKELKAAFTNGFRADGARSCRGHDGSWPGGGYCCDHTGVGNSDTAWMSLCAGCSQHGIAHAAVYLTVRFLIIELRHEKASMSCMR